MDRLWFGLPAILDPRPKVIKRLAVYFSGDASNA
jgi:hypothetical protein